MKWILRFHTPFKTIVKEVLYMVLILLLAIICLILADKFLERKRMVPVNFNANQTLVIGIRAFSQGGNYEK